MCTYERHRDTTRPAGPLGRRMGFLLYSVGGTARPSDRYSLPRTQSEIVYDPASPTRVDAMHHVKKGLLPRAGPALKLKLEEIDAESDAKGLESAFQTAKQKQVNAIMTIPQNL